LRLGRSLYLIVTLVVACCMFITTLAVGQNSDTAEGLRHAGYIVPVCCVLVAVGVILLGWSWLRLAGAVTSIAMFIKHDKTNTINRGSGFFSYLRKTKVDELCKAVNEHFNDCATRTAEYEKQIKDFQIQIQLSHKRGKNAEAIIYSIRDAVIVIDEYDRLLMANESAGQLFRFDFRNSQHRPLTELIDAEQGEFAGFLSHSRKSKGQATRREIEIFEDGERKTFDCIVSCVYDQSQKVCGIVAVMHDVTREKQIQQMKNDFVSHVSHELKTPLASITAYSEMLVDGEANDEKTRKEFYSVIQSQAKRLSRLIEDILNTSRIESGLIKVNKEPVSLTMLIEEQLQMIKGYAEEKNIEIAGQKPIVFDQVYVDRDMMSQVIINLLSNAVKYTPSGGTVRIATEVDEGASLARVIVTDTGVGIPEDEIEHVFEKFYRVGANKKQAKGTGLGLNLVKQMVETVHDGRVFVTSKVGVGSTFGFELPLATRQSASIVQKSWRT
jgi:two-component system phosphate regulon sensor histidine kinase PhoR